MLRRTRFAPAEKQLLARFWRSASGFWLGPSAWLAWLLLVVLVTTVILQLLTQYALNFWNRDFFDAIGRRDRAELWTQALRFVPLATASLALMVVQVWARLTTDHVARVAEQSPLRLLAQGRSLRSAEILGPGPSNAGIPDC